MSKKVQYSNMLKQALNEWDTSKTVDVKGPMLDDILSYDGGEHLKTHKDAASILERYYFNENLDKGVEVNDDATSLDSPSMDHTEGPGGEPQAGTSDKSSIDAFEDEIEKEIAAEMASLLEEEDKEDKEPDGDEEGGEAKGDHEEPDGDEKEEKKETANEAEKLASEIFSFLSETEEVSEEVVEEDVVEEEAVTEANEGSDEGADVESGEEIADENTIIERLIAEMEEENKATDSMEHPEGAGTEQAGTGDDASEIPDRKDDHMDYIERPKLEELMRVLEADEEGGDEAEAGDEADAEKKTNLDVDKEVKASESVVAEDAGAGGGPLPAARRKKNLEDQNADQADLEEAFKLFEAMEAEEDDVVVKENPKNMRV